MDENVIKNKKRQLFSFTTINKYFIFPFLSPIFCFLCNFFIDLIQKEKKNNSEFSIGIVYHLSYLGGGLLFFISSIRTQTEKTRNDAIVYKKDERPKIKYIYNDGSQKNKFHIVTILLIMSFLLVSSTISIFYANKYIVFERRLYFIFCIPIFSKCLLKMEIFKHQIVSLCIALIGFILLCIPVISKIENSAFLINSILFITSVGFSLFIVLCRYLTHNYYVSPYSCILLIGIISTIMTILGYIIYSLILNHNLDLIINSLDFSNIQSKGIFFYTF